MSWDDPWMVGLQSQIESVQSRLQFDGVDSTTSRHLQETLHHLQESITQREEELKQAELAKASKNALQSNLQIRHRGPNPHMLGLSKRNSSALSDYSDQLDSGYPAQAVVGLSLAPSIKTLELLTKIQQITTRLEEEASHWAPTDILSPSADTLSLQRMLVQLKAELRQDEELEFNSGSTSHYSLPYTYTSPHHSPLHSPPHISYFDGATSPRRLSPISRGRELRDLDEEEDDEEADEYDVELDRGAESLDNSGTHSTLRRDLLHNQFSSLFEQLEAGLSSADALLVQLTLSELVRGQRPFDAVDFLTNFVTSARDWLGSSLLLEDDPEQDDDFRSRFKSLERCFHKYWGSLLQPLPRKVLRNELRPVPFLADLGLDRWPDSVAGLLLMLFVQVRGSELPPPGPSCWEGAVLFNEWIGSGGLGDVELDGQLHSIVIARNFRSHHRAIILQGLPLSYSWPLHPTAFSPTYPTAASPFVFHKFSCWNESRDGWKVDVADSHGHRLEFQILRVNWSPWSCELAQLDGQPVPLRLLLPTQA